MAFLAVGSADLGSLFSALTLAVRPFAGHTSPSAGPFDAGIFGIVWMPFRAVSSIGQILAGFSPANILFVCDRIEMPRVHAATHSTEMVKAEAFRNRATKCLITKPVGSVKDPLKEEPPISSSNVVAHPNPAAGFGNYFDLLEYLVFMFARSWVRMRVKLVVSHSVSLKDRSVRLVAALIRCAGRFYFTAWRSV